MFAFARCVHRSSMQVSIGVVVGIHTFVDVNLFPRINYRCFCTQAGPQRNVHWAYGGIHQFFFNNIRHLFADTVPRPKLCVHETLVACFADKSKSSKPLYMKYRISRWARYSQSHAIACVIHTAAIQVVNDCCAFRHNVLSIINLLRKSKQLSLQVSIQFLTAAIHSSTQTRSRYAQATVDLALKM